MFPSLCWTTIMSTLTSALHLQTILPSVVLCLDLSQQREGLKIPKAVCLKTHLGVSHHMSQTSCHWRHLHIKEAQQDIFCLCLNVLGPAFTQKSLHPVQCPQWRNVTGVVELSVCKFLHIVECNSSSSHASCQSQ